MFKSHSPRFLFSLIRVKNLVDFVDFVFIYTVGYPIK